MALWSENTKHSTSEINGGIRYEKKDRVSREQLNAIVENSFYSVKKSEEAEEKANSAFEANGTLVKINGVSQPTWSADFAESERQKSKNLWADGDVSATRWTDVHLKKPLTAGTYTFSAVVTNTDTDSNYSLVEFYDESNTKIAHSSILKNERASFEFTLSRDCYRVSFIGNDSGTAGIDFTYTDIMITTDGSTDYQEYNGAITHNGDKPVVFAEEERQKSKNLFSVNQSSETTVGLTITGDSDNQKYTINGTSTSPLGFWLLYNSIKLKANKSYTFSIKTSGSATFNGYANLYFNGKNGGSAGRLSLRNPSETFTFTPTEDFETHDYILFDCENGNTFSNFEIQVQVEEGATATDWQYPYGAIVHEEDIERVKVIYDKDNKNSINGERYTSGINVETQINYDFSKYKKIIITCLRINSGSFSYEINLEQLDQYQGVYSGSGISYSYLVGDNYFVYSSATVSQNKQVFNYLKSGYTTDFFNTITSQNVHIVNIRGVY